MYFSVGGLEFPPETEDAYDPALYESAAKMLSKSVKKETNASEQSDDEVKLNSKKRKANSAPDKKEKVCVSVLYQFNCLSSTTFATYQATNLIVSCFTRFSIYHGPAGSLGFYRVSSA